MAEPGAVAGLSPDDPRAMLLAEPVGRVLGALAALQAHYGTLAGLAAGPLRDALRALAERKRDQAGMAAALGRPPAVRPGELDGAPAAASADGHPRWGVLLARAYAAERALEIAARETAAMVPEGTVRALALRLAAQADEDSRTVRKLYLRYS